MECEESLSLHFSLGWVQSTMHLGSPDDLVLDYTRMMMGFLLFKPDAGRIALIGLGGGSLAKYCFRYVPLSSFTAVEIDAEVIALRDKFQIPQDGRRFRVVQADGVEFVTRRNQKFDVLMLDAFDAHGLAPAMCTQDFYDHCFTQLYDGGILVANFLNDDEKFGTYISKIRESFDDQVVTIEACDNGNKIAFAFKGKDFPPPPASLRDRAIELNKHHSVNFHEAATKLSCRLL